MSDEQETTTGDGGDQGSARGVGGGCEEEEVVKVDDGRLWFYGKLKRSIRIAEVNPKNRHETCLYEFPAEGYFGKMVYLQGQLSIVFKKKCCALPTELSGCHRCGISIFHG